MSKVNNKSNAKNKKISSLFIQYPKKEMMEYITCKKYDVEEIKFYEEIEILNQDNYNIKHNYKDKL